jgi:23S rRNA (cytosine1962-C5)-methyltransferase
MKKMKKENNLIPLLLIPPIENDYELIDSGNGIKYERFGDFYISRPDKEVLWDKNLRDWDKLDAVYTRTGVSGNWKKNTDIPDYWNVKILGLDFVIRLTSFKHTGIFPEQVSIWSFLEEKIKNNIGEGRKINALNLFGYTGGASLAMARAGASVAHVDGSKSSIAWGKENAIASNLVDKPIRWILDDAQAFLKREIKRGNKYDVIVMDPPAFGRGPNDEEWNIEKDFSSLLYLCSQVLSDEPIAFVVSGYSAGYSPLAYRNALSFMVMKYGGELEHGELAIKESETDRLLPAGMFARWSK